MHSIELHYSHKLHINQISEIKTVSGIEGAISKAFVVKSSDGAGWHVLFECRGLVRGLASARNKDSLRVFKSIDAAFSAIRQCNFTQAIIDDTYKF